MLEAMTGLPPGVLGFEVSGALHADDYRDLLLPAVEAAIQRGEKVRIVLVFEGFDGLSGGALWQDLKMGVEHLTHWERIALVTDIDWMAHLTALFGWMTPGDLRRFPLAEREAAIAWAPPGIDPDSTPLTRPDANPPGDAGHGGHRARHRLPAGHRLGRGHPAARPGPAGSARPAGDGPRRGPRRPGRPPGGGRVVGVRVAVEREASG